MEKRLRSPNYPAFSLPTAIQRVTELYRNLHAHSAPREVIAKGMGYNSLNGASATAISALHKYGLLEKVGEEIKVSDRALRILHPHNEEEKKAAIREAAMDPPLFAELAEKFPGRIPTDELLRNYLVRNGFAPAAVTSVVLAYRETSQFAEEQGAAYDSGSTQSKEASSMHPTHSSGVTVSAPFSLQTPVNEREIARYNFEGGGFIRLVADPTTDTYEALDMVETLIKWKRAELEKRKARESEALKNITPLSQNLEDVNDDGT